MFKNGFTWLRRLLGWESSETRPAVHREVDRAASGSTPKATRAPAPPESAAPEGECLSFGAQATHETDAILGLDFGTSCLRAVVRLPFVPGALAFAVPLNDLGGPQYFQPVPTMPATDRFFGSAATNVKVRLIVDPADEEASVRAAVLLGRAMRKARCWFLRTQGKNYGKFRLKWAVNLGIPSAGYEDERVRQNFLRCARVGWRLSLREASLSDEAARALLASGHEVEAPVDTIPEIAAAAEGYRRSVHAKDGMHVMVDVGASTLDVCGFVIRGPMAPSPFGLFTTAVEQLGAAVLHDARLLALDGAAACAPAAAVDGRDPTDRVPDDLGAYVQAGAPIPAALRDVDRKFLADCQLAVRRVICGMWQKNRLSSQWKLGIPVFLIGGGGRMNFYRRLPVDIRQEKWDAVAWANLTAEELGAPSDLRPKGLPPEIVLRLLVATGLSWPRPDFGEFVNPASIPAMEPPPPRRLEDRYFDKDQM